MTAEHRIAKHEEWRQSATEADDGDALHLRARWHRAPRAQAVEQPERLID